MSMVQSIEVMKPEGEEWVIALQRQLVLKSSLYLAVHRRTHPALFGFSTPQALAAADAEIGRLKSELGALEARMGVAPVQSNPAFKS